MHDDFTSLFAFNRWANAKMLDACRQASPEQYVAGPTPGWASVRFTVWHIAIVTDGWLRTLADDLDNSVPTEAELATPDDAGRLLDRAYRRSTSCCPRSPRSGSPRRRLCEGADGRPRSHPGRSCGTS